MIKHYPKWYYYRRGVSDRDFIMVRMAHIPEDLQEEIADKYERLYLQNGHINVKQGRKEANEYLHKMARIYQSKCVQQGQLIEHRENPRQKRQSPVAYKQKNNKPPMPKGMGIKLGY